LDAEDDTEDWKCAFVTFAHATAHVVSIAISGSPPQNDIDGNSWILLSREHFFICNSHIAETFEPIKCGLFCFGLGQLLEQYGIESSSEWYAKAKQIAQITGSQLILAQASLKFNGTVDVGCSDAFGSTYQVFAHIPGRKMKY